MAQNNTTTVGESANSSNTTNVEKQQTFPGQDTINSLLEVYRSKQSITGASTDTYVEGINSFGKAINLIIKKNDPWAFQLLWNFFINNRDGMCQDQIALKGIDSVSFGRDRIVWTYLLFRGMTTGRNMVMSPGPYIDKIKNVDIVEWALNKQPGM